MEKYLITGATGYIGSMLAKRIISSRKTVSVIVRDASRLDEDILSNAEVIRADIVSSEDIFCITEKYDYIIHQNIYPVREPGHSLPLKKGCTVKYAIWPANFLSKPRISVQPPVHTGNR